MTRWIFKVLRPSEWQEASNTKAFTGAPVDEADGFIHFSTWAQLQETVKRHFTDEPEIHVLAFDAKHWDANVLKWEASRGGDLFPHLYSSLDVSLASARWCLSGEDKSYDEIESWLGHD